jgi:hypothetical protein
VNGQIHISDFIYLRRKSALYQLKDRLDVSQNRFGGLPLPVTELQYLGLAGFILEPAPPEPLQLYVTAKKAGNVWIFHDAVFYSLPCYRLP